MTARKQQTSKDQASQASVVSPQRAENAKKRRTREAKEATKQVLNELIQSNWSKLQKCIPSAHRRLDTEPNLVNEVVSMIVMGASVKNAVLAAGIDWSSHLDWQTKAKEGLQPYLDYSTKVQMAKDLFAARSEIAIHQIGIGAMRGDPKPLQYIMERRHPDEYRLAPLPTEVKITHADPSIQSNEDLEKLLVDLGYVKKTNE